MNFGQLAGNADFLPLFPPPPPNDFLLKLKMKVLEEEREKETHLLAQEFPPAQSYNRMDRGDTFTVQGTSFQPR